MEPIPIIEQQITQILSIFECGHFYWYTFDNQQSVNQVMKWRTKVENWFW